MDKKTIKKILIEYNGYYPFILKEIYNLPNDKKYKLLDVGAADKILKRLIPENITYYGLDLKGDYDYEVNLDKGKIPIKKNTFDIIICTETLEHILYPHKIMEELIRIAKSDATFILSMPNELNFYIRLQYLFNIKSEVQMPFQTILKHGHIHTPRTKDILKFFSDYLTMEKIHYCWYSRNFSRSNGIKRNLLFIFDSLIDSLSKVRPSLFARNITVIGTKRYKENY